MAVRLLPDTDVLMDHLRGVPEAATYPERRKEVLAALAASQDPPFAE